LYLSALSKLNLRIQFFLCDLCAFVSWWLNRQNRFDKALFDKTEFAWEKAVGWSERKEEFIKRAGFVLMAKLAVHDKSADNRAFEQFFPVIKREAAGQRNFVKKGINWALRQIGKRNKYLNRLAV